MSNRVMKTQIQIGGKVDRSLRKVLNYVESSSTKSAQKAGRNMKRSMKSAADSTGKAMSNAFSRAARTAAKLFLVVKSAARLKDFARECMTAAKAQIEVETKLETVLGNVKSIQIRGPNAAQQAAENLKKTASDIQSKGVIGDEVLIAGQQQMATFQLDDSTISSLSGSMADLLAQQKGLNATQGDAVNIGNMIGKVMTGQVGALKRVGISFDSAQEKALKYGSQQEKAATLSKVLQENVGGVNAALAQTDQGKMQQATNAIGDAKEEIGKGLLPIVGQLVSGALPFILQGIQGITSLINKVKPVVTSIIDSLVKKASTFIPQIVGFVQSLLPAVLPVISTIQSSLNGIMPVILNSLQSLAPVIMTIVNSIVPMLGPLISTILPVLVKYISLVANNIGSFISILLPPLTQIIDSLAPALMMILNEAEPIYKDIFSVLSMIINFVVSSVMPVINLILPILSNLITQLLPPIHSIIQSIMGVISALLPVLNVIIQVISIGVAIAIQTITPIITTIANVISSIIGVLSGLIKFIAGVFTGNWKGAWQGVVSIFTSVFGGIKAIMRGILQGILAPVNAIITGINGVSGALHLGKKFKTIQVPKFANGATVTRPTLAMVGEGRDHETIVPHNNKPRSRALLNEAARGVGATGNSTSNKYIFAPVIYANDSSGVKSVLEDEFAKFQEFVSRKQDDDDREVFA